MSELRATVIKRTLPLRVKSASARGSTGVSSHVDPRAAGKSAFLAAEAIGEWNARGAIVGSLLPQEYLNAKRGSTAIEVIASVCRRYAPDPPMPIVVDHLSALTEETSLLNPGVVGRLIDTLVADAARRLARSQGQVTQREESDRRLFSTLADSWRRETMRFSGPNDLAMNWSYQRIVGMGERALPWIFAALREREEPWYWALGAITGADPVPREHNGKASLIREDWLRWGRENGF